MDESTFWDIIETGNRVANSDAKKVIDSIRAQLVQLSPTEIESFQRVLNDKINATYSWDLWGAAYIINGGC